MHKILKKYLALVVAICVAVSAQPQVFARANPSTLSAVGVKPFALENVASQGRTYDARDSKGMVTIIEDAHGNYEGQKNIAALLEKLVEQDGVQSILVEGAIGPLSAQYLTYFADPVKNLELAHTLMQSGELNGVEWFLMNRAAAFQESLKPVFVEGIEDAALYRQAFDSFRQVQTEQEGIAQFQAQLVQMLDAITAHLFSKPLYQFVREWRAYHTQSIELKAYIDHLSKAARKVFNLDLLDVYHQAEFPHLVRLLQIDALQADLQPKLIEQEARVFLRSVAHFIPEELYQQLEALCLPGSSVPDNPRQIMETLYAATRGGVRSFEQWPRLRSYIAQQIYQSEIASQALFDEIDRLEEQLLNSLAVTREEQRGLSLVKDQMLLQKLLSLHLTTEEYGRLQYRSEALLPEAFLERMTAMSTTKLPEMDIGNMAAVTRSALKFYEAAIARERSFLNTLEADLLSSQDQRAVLVMGGFHTSGIRTALEAAGYSYRVYAPQLENPEEGYQNYLRAMTADFKEVKRSQLMLLAQLIGWQQQRLLAGKAYLGYRNSANLRAAGPLIVGAQSLGTDQERRVRVGEIDSMANIMCSNAPSRRTWR